MANRWGNSGTSDRLFCWAPKSLQMVTAAMKWKETCFLEEKLWSTLVQFRVRLFATTWITARQASLSITNSWSSHKLTSIESVIRSSHLIHCCPLLLLPPTPPSIRVFSNESSFAWGGQSIGVSALASVLPKNTQDWSPLGWTGWISLQSKGLSRVFSNTTVQKDMTKTGQDQLCPRWLNILLSVCLEPHGNMLIIIN